MTAQTDALQLLRAGRTDDEATLTSVIARCDKDAVIRALVEHFYGIDDAYFGSSTSVGAGACAEDILDLYLDVADVVSRV